MVNFKGILMRIVIFDTETTGLFDQDLPELHLDQPWILQLGAVVLGEDWEIIESLNTVVIPAADCLFQQSAIELHGLTPEVVLQHGKPTIDVLKTFRTMCEGASIIASYNLAFDKRVINTTALRTDTTEFTKNPLWSPDTFEHCVMMQAQEWFGQRVKLNQCYKRLYDAVLENAHDAFADTIAATECFRYMCGATQF